MLCGFFATLNSKLTVNLYFSKETTKSVSDIVRRSQTGS